MILHWLQLVTLTNSLIYIYIYIEREREREREICYVCTIVEQLILMELENERIACTSIDS